MSLQSAFDEMAAVPIQYCCRLLLLYPLIEISFEDDFVFWVSATRNVVKFAGDSEVLSAAIICKHKCV